MDDIVRGRIALLLWNKYISYNQVLNEPIKWFEELAQENGISVEEMRQFVEETKAAIRAEAPHCRPLIITKQDEELIRRRHRDDSERSHYGGIIAVHGGR